MLLLLSFRLWKVQAYSFVFQPISQKQIDNALNLAEKAGDKYVTAERILQAMLMAKKMDISGYLEDAGLTDEKLNQAINDMRKGRTADSANAEDQFEALSKYASDLTAAAQEGKIDPIIGRDEEIRRTIQVLVTPYKEQPCADWRAGRG